MNLHVRKTHVHIYKYMQSRYRNVSTHKVIYTCAFSFLFWCRFWISFGSWEAIFCVIDPWWGYKALLTAGGEEKQKKLKLNRGSSKNLLRFSSSRRSHCWYTLRWSWKLTFSPQAWQEQREWSSWAAWSPLAMRCLRPHMRLWWWPACCPPPSLQTATTNKKDDDDGNIQTVTADVREKQTFIYHVREPWLHFELFKKAFLLRQVGRWTAG